ncbi:uncharacterized protein C9orf43 homolog isoform X2 [Vicugna pacos]|uniref:Uncharacterized protein C9orf43 homolog isoform X2 n=1 Tax=Vicugna pacos TaxID=30538 RepID=A0ABM5D590_VICPA
MDLPDESQWDETTCGLAVCQHPQCWATIRRIERGHPRILGSSCKSPLNAEDRLPVLTLVNIADSCFQARRLAHHHLSEFTFTKPPSLLPQGSKFGSKFQGRPWKDLPNKDVINRTNRSPKLSVLNLNETQLPSAQDVRNMVVIWIPEEPEKHVGLAEKKHIVTSQDGRMKRKKYTEKDKSAQFFYENQNTETQLGPLRTIVSPPSPVHLFEQPSSESVPLWKRCDMLPQDLLEDLLLDKGKPIPYPEMKTHLAMMKKKPPLEKSRPDSAISARMCLTVHRLTLQRPALRYPEHLKKFYCNLTTENHRNLPGRESCKKQQKQMKIEGPTLKQAFQDSTEKPQVDYSKKHLDSFPSKKSPELPRIERTHKDIRTQMEVLLEAQKRTPNSTSGIGWNPELKLLRILQATGDEDEENQPSGAQSEESLEA